MRKLDKIILHCTATPEGQDTNVEAIRKDHLRRGFSDIGYHYVIYRDGSIHEGRPIEKIGAHTTGYNTGSVGICYVGGLENKPGTPYKKLKPKDTRTEAQKKSMEWLIRKLMQEYPTIKEVHGHYEYANKACPSFDVAFWLRTIHLESCINLIKEIYAVSRTKNN